MKRTAIYVDFDNIYSAVLDNWWFSKKTKPLREEDLDFVSRLSYIDDGKKEEVFTYQCAKFEEKVIPGLKREEYATTGLIIESWLPKWNLEMDVRQANECLRRLILSGKLGQDGIFFEESGKKDGFIVGKFRRKENV